MSIRQTRRYTALVSLYEPAAQSSVGTSKRATDQAHTTTPAYTNVPCAYKPTPNQSYDEYIGRTLRQQIFSLDQFNFYASQEIADGWVIKLTGYSDGSTSDDIGKVWTCLGNAQTVQSSRSRKPNYKHILAREGIAQPGM